VYRKTQNIMFSGVQHMIHDNHDSHANNTKGKSKLEQIWLYHEYLTMIDHLNVTVGLSAPKIQKISKSTGEEPTKC